MVKFNFYSLVFMHGFQANHPLINSGLDVIYMPLILGKKNEKILTVFSTLIT